MENKVICPNCKTKQTKKDGKRKTENRGFIQRHKCLECNKRFVIDDCFFKIKHKREVITACLNLYMNGLSLRKCVEYFNQFSDYQVSFWIKCCRHRRE